MSLHQRVEDISATKNVKTRYKGLFASHMAPTSRAYCILFSFFIGILMITAGSVFYHVNTLTPSNGMHLIHTPPIPLAIFLILGGILSVIASFVVALKYGFDDGDDSLEEDQFSFAKDDVLDQHHQCQSKLPPV
ncbi:hypothetical protein SK128_001646 [Halocaridina rubra]|uniref:Uncharacterized protein n=1 Tax=Halocaridina rubra TaxID=373956 RepID=A0AAN9A924_HALRR